MAKPSKKTPEEKMRVVLAVLREEAPAAEAGVSEQTVSNWKRAFLESGRAGLDGSRARRSSRELELEAENEELKAALGEAHVELRVWKKGAEFLPPIEDFEMIRTEAQLSVSRFAELIGVPRRTYHYRLARHRAGDPAGVWPAPVLDRIEPTVAKYAEARPARGHRKVRALARADGHDVGSQASVARAMRRRDLLQPVNYQAERRELAKARRAVFVDPPTRRNRVWQFDFSEFETTSGGTWRLGGTVDYVAKVALGYPVTATGTAADMIAALNTAEAAEASAEDLLGAPLIFDCVDDDWRLCLAETTSRFLHPGFSAQLSDRHPAGSSTVPC